MRSDNEAMRIFISKLSSRLALLEETSMKHREEVLETQDNLEETQKMLRLIEGKFEATQEIKGKSEVWERLETLEKKEQGKVRLFEALGKEVETLRAAHADSSRQIQALEGQLKAEIARNELLSKLHSDKVENTTKSIPNLLSKQDQMEAKFDKLRREIHDILRTRCKKEVSEAFKKVETRLQTLESTLQRDMDRGSDLTSARADAPMQLTRLEERLCDVEREMGNFSTVKKKLLETTKRVKGIEKGLGPSKEALTPIQTEEFHQVEKANMTSSTRRAAHHRPLTPSLKENSSEAWGTERGLSDFLPGEAESVVLGALMERTRRGKKSLADIKLSYRSNSPSKSSAVRAREPSVDLQEFLRQKGFSFSEAQ
jgi:chromosome segregation ATPase